jgi:uncharacterized protein YkwD
MTLGGKLKKQYVRAALAIALLAAFSVGFAGVQSASASDGDTLISLANQNRAQAGLGPLRHNTAMDAVAMRWAQQMAAANTMSHNPGYSTQIPAGWRRAGENVAEGQLTPADMEAAWWASPGHHANIVGDYTDIGAAFFTDSTGQTWGVQNFAKYVAAAPAPAPAPVAAAPRAGQAAPAAAPARQAAPAVAAPAAAAPAAPTPVEAAPVVTQPVPVVSTAAPSPQAHKSFVNANLKTADGLASLRALKALNVERTSAVTAMPIGYIIGIVLVVLGLAGGVWSGYIRRRGHREKATAVQKTD